jgi:drug/metabolite transporter (DMT)-like permease
LQAAATRFQALAPRTRAILLMMCTVVCFAVLESTAKYLTRFHPVPQVVWARYTVHFALMLALVAPRVGLALVRTQRPGGQLLRATLLLGSTLCNFGAVSVLPLAEVKAISFISPLLVTVFAVWLLRERVSADRWLAVAVGFAGVLFIVRPGSAMLSWASALALGTALCYSLYQVMTRSLSDEEAPLTTLFYTALVGFLVMSLAVPAFWITPTLRHAMLFLLLGATGAVGHFLLIKALELERASALSPFGYMQLIWVTLLGYLIFGDLPDEHAVAGMMIIVGSGLYVAWGHRARRQEEPDSAIE